VKVGWQVRVCTAQQKEKAKNKKPSYKAGFFGVANSSIYS